MNAPPQRELLLLLVAFHPCSSEIQSLQDCLRTLPSTIGYCLVINDYQPGEPVETLFTMLTVLFVILIIQVMEELSINLCNRFRHCPNIWVF